MTDQQLAQALGDLRQAFGNLQGTVHAMADQWHRQENTASAGRKALYERFELMSTQMGRVSSDCKVVVEDVAELKNDIEKKIMPTIDSYRSSQDRRGGAMDVGKVMWALILAAATVVGFAIHEALVYLGHIR